MRCLLILFLVFLLPFLNLAAQSNDTIYLGKSKWRVTLKSEAAYYSIISYADINKTEATEITYWITGEKESERSFTLDKTLGMASRTFIGQNTTWFKNGQIKTQANFVAGKQEGKETHWYESGPIYYESHYIHDKKQGEALTFYLDGKLKRKEKFDQDILVDGKCFTQAGSDTVYFPKDQMPGYPGGEVALNNFIRRNLKYDKQAYKERIKGLVILQFVIDKTGHMNDIEIIKKLHPALDAECIRVVGLMNGKWLPARQEGQPASFRYTLPIRYSF